MTWVRSNWTILLHRALNSLLTISEQALLLKAQAHTSTHTGNRLKAFRNVCQHSVLDYTDETKQSVEIPYSTLELEKDMDVYAIKFEVTADADIEKFVYGIGTGTNDADNGYYFQEEGSYVVLEAGKKQEVMWIVPSSISGTAPDKSEKWWSSDTDIATVNYEGWIVGVSPGECIVTVQSVNNPDVTAEIKVTVIDNRVNEIKLDKYEITIGVNQGDIPLVTMLPADAPDKSEKWWSSDTSIATVNYEGGIVGVSPGKCTVTVQSVNNPDVKAEVSVTVIDNRVAEIKLDRYEITIKKGFGDMPLVTMLPADAPDKSEIWKSSNTNVATVNFEGWIYAITPGECTVTVYSAANPDIKAEVKVIVTE